MDSTAEQARNRIISQLLEPSSVLKHKLLPLLHSTTPLAESLSELENLLYTLSDDTQAQFLHAHPKIGQKNITSILSNQEQDTSKETKEVDEQLSILNEIYERSYPGLAYVTFVNGREKSEIVTEMLRALGVESSLPVAETLEGFVGKYPIKVRGVGGAEWKLEVKRGIKATFAIARSRMANLNVQSNS